MQVAGQMLFAQIVKDALSGPFEYCVKRFGGVVVDIPTGIFLAVVVDPQMRRILFADPFIGMQFIGSKMRPFINESFNDGRQNRDTVAGNRY